MNQEDIILSDNATKVISKRKENLVKKDPGF